MTPPHPLSSIVSSNFGQNYELQTAYPENESKCYNTTQASEETVELVWCKPKHHQNDNTSSLLLNRIVRM